MSGRAGLDFGILPPKPGALLTLQPKDRWDAP
jgi:hypothetical protein